VFYLLGLFILAIACSFNGLYGQDAHEYLRQSRVIFDRWQGLPVPPLTPGDTQFAGGYPLLGAILHFLTGDSIIALQLVSWMSAAVGLWVFERLLALLAPGARVESRWVYAGLGLAMSSMFVRAGLTSMSDSLGLLLALASFFFGLRVFENSRNNDAIWAAAFAALAFSTRYALAALLIPSGVALLYTLAERRKWGSLLGAGLVFCLALLPHFWLKTAGAENPLGHSTLGYWSVANFFKSSFTNVEGGLSKYVFPNLLFVLFPLFHPAFCLLLPGLCLLFKKTDLVLSSKKILLANLITYLVLLGGIPHQNLRYLLPAYALLLLLLFPAWDRFYCYGFLFFRRLTTGILVAVVACQLFFCAKYLAPTLSRNRLEQTVANELKSVLPANATVYAFDLDIALRSYLPNVLFQNLWERRYTTFPAGSFVLFNEALRPQWQGQNPILNWDQIRENYTLEQRAALPNGWYLWEIVE
jgi:4-amino-4-deoxy-L-arabinose transferase-like glycosyltransferase